jgi:hypothetical protein
MLSACSTSLTKRETDITFGTAVPQNAIVGDTVTLTTHVTLAEKRTDRVILALQSSPDGKVWTTVKTKSAKGPHLSIVDGIKIKTAGVVMYRATVSLPKKGKQFEQTPRSAPINVIDIKGAIRDFYYAETQAYQQSPLAGVNWDNAHDTSWYPKTNALWKRGMAAAVKAKEVDTAVPDLTTIAPDPKWELSKSPCSAAMTEPPAGRTFIVTVTGGGTYNGFSDTATKSDVHVTLNNGQLVDYDQFC